MINSRTIARVEKILRDDIRWAIKHPRYKWDPARGAYYSGGSGRWMSSASWGRPPKRCGLCAIAAHLVRRQPPVRELVAGVVTPIDGAARALKVPRELVCDVYSSVGHDKRSRYREPSRPGALGYRLRDYADAYQKQWRARQRAKAAAKKARA